MVPTGLLALTLSGGTHDHNQALLRSPVPGGATVKIEPWGANSLRVRVALAGHAISEDVGALIPPGSDNKGAAVVPASPVAVDDVAGRITNGNIAATVGADGLISVSRVSDNAVILQEINRTTSLNQSLDGNPRYNQTTVIFAAQKSDKVFGMGEHQHGQLDNKNVLQVAYRDPPKGPVMLKDWRDVSYDFEQCTVYRGGASQNGLGGNGGGSVCIPWIITAKNGTNATTKKAGFGLSYVLPCPFFCCGVALRVCCTDLLGWLFYLSNLHHYCIGTASCGTCPITERCPSGIQTRPGWPRRRRRLIILSPCRRPTARRRRLEQRS
jgi:hypothetical protein